MLQYLFDIFVKASAALVAVIIISHFVAKLCCKKIPLKLDKNSLVVITGACMGIGKQMALQLAKLYQCRLLVIDRRKDLFDGLAAQVTQAGGTCECKYTDLGDKQSVNELTEYLLGQKQKINLFLYNAGILFSKKTWQISQEQHELVMRVNYFTPTYMITKLEPLLEGNHISVVASMAAIVSGGTNVSTYTASKHALFAYLSSLRQQYKKHNRNITVSIGCPYAINTTLLEGFKTKLDFFFRILDEKYVGRRLVKQFIQKKQVCFMYEYEAVIFKLIEMMPTSIIDYGSIKMDVSNFTNVQSRQQTQLKSKSQ